MKIFGIDPGSERTGYGCVERSGGRHQLVLCGSLAAPASATFPERLKYIHAGLAALIDECRPDCVAVESIFYAKNVRSALKLGHARGVALLAASEAGLCVFEYAPTEVKRAVVGYGRADKPQVAQMVRALLRVESIKGPLDVSDALAVAICHLHNSTGPAAIAIRAAKPSRGTPRTWREYRPS